MKVIDIVNKLGLEIISGKEGLQNEITGCYVSDLLSDVMGNSESGNLWITLQSHKNIMAVASLKELSAVILIGNNKPEKDTIDSSNQENIPILGTDKLAFEVAGKLYQLLKTD
jgi:predicted transcriptional regulator